MKIPRNIKRSLALLFLLALMDKSGFAQNIRWVKQIGGTLHSHYSYAMTMDKRGSIYTTGVFRGDTDFDPGPDSFFLTSAFIKDDTFILKLDSSGNFVWAKSLLSSGAKGVIPNAIVLDHSDNIIVSGYFDGTVDFDPGPGVYNLTSNGEHDVFVVKLNNKGDFIWAKQIGGASFDGAASVLIDDKDNIIVGGYFSGAVDFDPGLTQINLTSFGKEDFFLAKLDGSGNFSWAKQFGGKLYDNLLSTCLDQTGNLLITGYFAGTADFDPDTSVFNLTSKGKDDIFILKLDSTGDLLWVKSIGGTELEHGSRIKVDPFGSIILTGGFAGSVDFDPDTAIYNLSSTFSYNCFVLKLDSSGNFLWAKKPFGVGYSFGYSLDIDYSGYIYVQGSYTGQIDFDPNGGGYKITSNGNEDFFVWKMDLTGKFVWIKGWGGKGQDNATQMIVDNEKNILLTGAFQKTVDFDTGNSLFTLTSLDYDVYVLKLSTSNNGIYQHQDIIKFSIFPNPSSNNINVLAGNLYDSTKYIVLNAMGTEVLNGTLNEINSSINVKELSSGLYFFYIPEYSQSIKFIKL